MKTILCCLFLLLYSFPGYSAESYTPETVPNVRLSDRFNHVSNPDNIISAENTHRINALLSSLEDSLSIEVAVVALASVGDTDAKEFATNLFNRWKLGKKGKDNGLLILLVTDQRAVVFETGYGIEGVLPDAICYRLQQKYMIPALKENKFSLGMLNGVAGVKTYLLASDYSKEELLDKKTASAFLSDKDMARGKKYLFIYLLICGVAAFLIGRNLSTLQKRKPQLNAVEVLERVEVSFRQLGCLTAALFLPAYPFLLLWFKSYRQKLKKRTAVCPQCGGNQFRKLSEKDEKPYLNPQEQCENDLKSVEHSVYRCDDCTHIFKIGTEPMFSKYSRCPRCNTKAYVSGGEQTIVRPSYTATGIAEEVFTCKMCNHTDRIRKQLDRLTRNGALAGGVVGGFLGGGGGGSFGGGGSWGGGSSGGGGGTSRF